MSDRPAYITDADWDIIKARFERLERRAEQVEKRLYEGASATLRVLENPPAPRTIDGRTLTVLVQWAQTIVYSGCDVVEIDTTAEQRSEIAAAILHVKEAMEGVQFKVTDE